VKAGQDVIDDSRLGLSVLGWDTRLAPNPDSLPVRILQSCDEDKIGVDIPAPFNLRRDGPASGVAVYPMLGRSRSNLQ
jgi:hypothetical protein